MDDVCDCLCKCCIIAATVVAIWLPGNHKIGHDHVCPGYQIQPPTLTTILKRYSRVVPPNGRCIVAFDDFVALSVRLRAYTGKQL